jgi:hypothetical protein
VRRIAPLLVAMAVAAGAGWYLREEGRGTSDPGVAPTAGYLEGAGSRIAPADAAREAFEQRAKGRMLQAEGRVIRLLADDREGSPHQRFIIETNDGLTLLVAHNLGLAPRLEGLVVGEVVRVFGEYEWSAQGGVMHWTHDDPRGDHVTGYIEWRGRRYQ